MKLTSNKVLLKSAIFVCLAISLLVSGCVSVRRSNNIIAYVDGEAVTTDDLQYAIEIAHRREMEKTGSININNFVLKLIDDRLIIQEARRSGLAEDPQIQEKIDAYILRESVTRLYNEEIVQKVSVSEQEILDYFKQNYSRFYLELIETESEDDARDASSWLNQGEKFEVIARKYSIHPSASRGGRVTMERRMLKPDLLDIVDQLKQGQYSNVIKSGGNYYILRLLNTEEADDKRLDALRQKIESILKQNKIQKRSAQYLQMLYDEASPFIDKDIIDSIPSKMSMEERSKWFGDKRPVARVYDYVLPVGQFVRMMRPRMPDDNARSRIIRKWIDQKLVDHEALRRHYEHRPDFASALRRYLNELIKNTFVQRYISSKIKITDNDLRDYYSSHKDEFMKPLQYKFQQITLKSEKDARDVLKGLETGADFAWVARKYSIDSHAAKGGNTGWRFKYQLASPLQKVIDSMQAGDITPIIKDGQYFRIFKLLEKSDPETEPFRKVRPLVHRKAFNNKLYELYESYVSQLRKEAKIEIQQNVVESLSNMIKNTGNEDRK